jgi:predicted lipid-binding transport protein (Tim44 family)
LACTAKATIYAEAAESRLTMVETAMKRVSANALKRCASLAAAALLVGATFAPLEADARAGRGGSFGSRGTKTFSAPPPTATMPGVAPMQRSTTAQPGPSFGNNAAAQAAPRRGGFFGGGLGAGLMGGLLGAGLFGLLSGSGLFGGLGSLSSLFGLLIQGALIFLVVRLVMGWFARRKAGAQPATAGGPSSYSLNRDSEPSRDAPRGGLGGGLGGSGFGRGFGFGGGAAEPATAPLTLDKDDFDLFEARLSEVQAAWSAQDIERMRSLATPEVVQDFAEDLADDASRGVVNRVTDVKLLQGDLAEAWSEGPRDYATVAMRYSLIDVTEDKATGRVVDGDPSRPTEAAEMWTFVRTSSSNWLLSAIQQAA